MYKCEPCGLEFDVEQAWEKHNASFHPVSPLSERGQFRGLAHRLWRNLSEDSRRNLLVWIVALFNMILSIVLAFCGSAYSSTGNTAKVVIICAFVVVFAAFYAIFGLLFPILTGAWGYAVAILCQLATLAFLLPFIGGLLRLLFYYMIQIPPVRFLEPLLGNGPLCCSPLSLSWAWDWGDAGHGFLMVGISLLMLMMVIPIAGIVVFMVATFIASVGYARNETLGDETDRVEESPMFYMLCCFLFYKSLFHYRIGKRWLFSTEQLLCQGKAAFGGVIFVFVYISMIYYSAYYAHASFNLILSAIGLVLIVWCLFWGIFAFRKALSGGESSYLSSHHDFVSDSESRNIFSIVGSVVVPGYVSCNYTARVIVALLKWMFGAQYWFWESGMSTGNPLTFTAGGNGVGFLVVACISGGGALIVLVSYGLYRVVKGISSFINSKAGTESVCGFLVREFRSNGDVRAVVLSGASVLCGVIYIIIGSVCRFEGDVFKLCAILLMFIGVFMWYSAIAYGLVCYKTPLPLVISALMLVVSLVWWFPLFGGFLRVCSNQLAGVFPFSVGALLFPDSATVSTLLGLGWNWNWGDSFGYVMVLFCFLPGLYAFPVSVVVVVMCLMFANAVGLSRFARDRPRANKNASFWMCCCCLCRDSIWDWRTIRYFLSSSSRTVLFGKAGLCGFIFDVFLWPNLLQNALTSPKTDSLLLTHFILGIFVCIFGAASILFSLWGILKSQLSETETEYYDKDSYASKRWIHGYGVATISIACLFLPAYVVCNYVGRLFVLIGKVICGADEWFWESYCPIRFEYDFVGNSISVLVVFVIFGSIAVIGAISWFFWRLFKTCRAVVSESGSLLSIIHYADTRGVLLTVFNALLITGSFFVGLPFAYTGLPYKVFMMCVFLSIFVIWYTTIATVLPVLKEKWCRVSLHLLLTIQFFWIFPYFGGLLRWLTFYVKEVPFISLSKFLIDWEPFLVPNVADLGWYYNWADCSGYVPVAMGLVLLLQGSPILALFIYQIILVIYSIAYAYFVTYGRVDPQIEDGKRRRHYMFCCCCFRRSLFDPKVFIRWARDRTRLNLIGKIGLFSFLGIILFAGAIVNASMNPRTEWIDLVQFVLNVSAVVTDVAVTAFLVLFCVTPGMSPSETAYFKAKSFRKWAVSGSATGLAILMTSVPFFHLSNYIGRLFVFLLKLAFGADRWFWEDNMAATFEYDFVGNMLAFVVTLVLMLGVALLVLIVFGIMKAVQIGQGSRESTKRSNIDFPVGKEEQTELTEIKSV